MRILLEIVVSLVLVYSVKSEVNFTSTILPTEVVIKTVEVEGTGKKIEVHVRKFNTSGLSDNNYPAINCSMQAQSPTADFAWSFANGSAISTDPGVKHVRWPATGSLDTNLVTNSLRFTAFATKGSLYVGEYKCTAAANITRQPTVRSAPVVKMSEKDYRSVMEGDKLTQTCSVIAYPAPTIVWKKDGVTVSNEAGRIVFSANNATMTINDLKKEDAGVYVCSANNTLGTGESYIKLRVKDRLAALWPFLGIVAEVIVLVTIILLYEKKRAAQKRSHEEQDPAEVKDDRNANDSDVRQRAVKS